MSSSFKTWRRADYYCPTLRRSGIKRATMLWNRMRHNGLEDGAPLIQEFRKEAEAAAAHDLQSKKKP